MNEDIQVEIDNFQERVDKEVEDFNKYVGTAVSKMEDTIRKQVNVQSYRDYSEYVRSVMQRNSVLNCDLEQVLSEEEWRKRKEG